MMSASKTREPIGFIGAGEIAAAIVRGMNREGARSSVVLLSPRGRSVVESLQQEFETVRVCASNVEVVENAEFVVVAVRPQIVPDVLRAVRFTPTQVVVSVAAGVGLDMLRAAVAPAQRVARAVPLPSAAFGQSLTAVYPAEPAAVELFERVGAVIVADSEAGLDALSAATATLAAHIDYVDAIANWLAAHDVTPEVAVRYARHLLGGLGSSLLDPLMSLDALARQHATPGGINEQFLAALHNAGSREAITRALDAVFLRLHPQ
jgi:pyrroline-5-carboxylate reductase